MTNNNERYFCSKCKGSGVGDAFARRCHKHVTEISIRCCDVCKGSGSLTWIDKIIRPFGNEFVTPDFSNAIEKVKEKISSYTHRFKKFKFSHQNILERDDGEPYADLAYLRSDLTQVQLDEIVDLAMPRCASISEGGELFFEDWDIPAVKIKYERSE